MVNGLHPAEVRKLKRLLQMHEQALPTDEELERIEIAPGFSARMHTWIDEIAQSDEF